jgi:hypothetical protein
MGKPWFRLLPFVSVAALSVLAAGDAGAEGPTPIALGEVAVPPPSSGVDFAALKSAAEGEIRGVDASRLRKKRPVVVSVAVVGSTPSPYTCTVSALLRDAKTGTMLAILEGHAHADGDTTAELRNRVLRSAVRVAMSQIPEALAAN